MEKLGEPLEFRLAFDGELPGSDGGVVVMAKMLVYFWCISRGERSWLL